MAASRERLRNNSGLLKEEFLESWGRMLQIGLFASGYL